MAERVFFFTQSVKFIKYLSRLLKSSHLFLPISRELLFLTKLMMRLLYLSVCYLFFFSSSDLVLTLGFGLACELNASCNEAQSMVVIYLFISLLLEILYVREVRMSEDGALVVQSCTLSSPLRSKRGGLRSLDSLVALILKNLVFILSLIYTYFLLSLSSSSRYSLNFSSYLLSVASSLVSALAIMSMRQYLCLEGLELDLLMPIRPSYQSCGDWYVLLCIFIAFLQLAIILKWVNGRVSLVSQCGVLMQLALGFCQILFDFFIFKAEKKMAQFQSLIQQVRAQQAFCAKATVFVKFLLRQIQYFNAQYTQFYQII